ncbi:hypothetical protein MKD35_140 [Aureococcus anophagefferens virus]|nr:hypothetical protein MKD35_140 [Aureococcus anophagefferens virus]
MILELIIEAVIVGIVILAVGTLLAFIISRFFKTNLPSICKTWNKNHIMEITLFLTGFFAHLFFEVVGANSYYVKYKSK